MEKNSFFARPMEEQLKELKYNVTVAELDIQQLSEAKESYEAALLYMECDVKEKSHEVVYLRDKAVEEDIPVFYMGEDMEKLQEIDAFFEKHIHY